MPSQSLLIRDDSVTFVDWRQDCGQIADSFAARQIGLTEYNTRLLSDAVSSQRSADDMDGGARGRCWALLVVSLGAAGIGGCGGRLVESAPAQPLQPVALPPAAPGGTAAPDFSELSRVPASSVLPPNGDQNPARYHEVRQGETLSGIARQYGTTVDQLEESNGFESTVVLQPGQLIYIPTP